MDMLRYFVAGNLWAFVAIVLTLGRRPWCASPARYEFLGYGSLDPISYNLIIVFCVTAAAIFFLLAWKTQQKQ
jgi:hypothetical protein